MGTRAKPIITRSPGPNQSITRHVHVDHNSNQWTRGPNQSISRPRGPHQSITETRVLIQTIKRIRGPNQSITWARGLLHFLAVWGGRLNICCSVECALCTVCSMKDVCVADAYYPIETTCTVCWGQEKSSKANCFNPWNFARFWDTVTKLNC